MYREQGRMSSTDWGFLEGRTLTAITAASAFAVFMTLQTPCEVLLYVSSFHSPGDPTALS